MDRTKSEILRYLGRRGQDVPQSISLLVDDCLDMMRNTVSARHVARAFDVIAKPGEVRVAGTELVLRGLDIARHLSGCSRAVLMAVTLGQEADALIRSWERMDITRALILDACATQLVEEACDDVQRSITSGACSAGIAATSRYSPGYGDFSLEAQPGILAVLDAGRKIGLTCTDSLILLPRKSVTAVIGLGNAAPSDRTTCESCNMCDACEYRRDGYTNGCPGMD